MKVITFIINSRIPGISDSTLRLHKKLSRRRHVLGPALRGGEFTSRNYLPFKTKVMKSLYIKLTEGLLIPLRDTMHSHSSEAPKSSKESKLKVGCLFQGWVEWITYLPGLFCIAANLFFFLNIFYILLTKLRAPHANEPTNFRKAVREPSAD